MKTWQEIKAYVESDVMNEHELRLSVPFECSTELYSLYI